MNFANFEIFNKICDFFVVLMTLPTLTQFLRKRVRSSSGCKQHACQQISRHVIEQEFHQPAQA